jgi:hypothetical protein
MNKEKFGFFELTVPIAEILSGARAHGSQWFSHKMKDRHPLQLKKTKSWEPFWSHQQNSIADLVN